jgi:DNA-binding transcriptional MocR family regulator
LQPGDRLPPQRIFAYERGIAASTAGRVYGELRRRGLVTGETGRGTFVRAVPPFPHAALAEPPAAPVNMETNYPILPDQQAWLAPLLQTIVNSPTALHAALRDISVRGTAAIRDRVARGLDRPGWRPAAESLLFTGNGRQALAAAFSTLVPIGQRIGFEALTYPVAKAITERLGLVAVPLAMDADGLRPDAIEAAHRAGPLRAIYLQPSVHNPLGVTMPMRRRLDIAQLLERLDGPIAVEDSVYAFLETAPAPPLRALAPEHVILVDCLSKRIGPGLTLGFLSAPDRFVTDLAAAIGSGAWGPAGFAMDVGVRWLGDGTVAALTDAKRLDAAARQSLARRCLEGLAITANPQAYHLMLDCLDTIRAATLVERAARHGIAITPAAAFAVAPAYAPNAVRIGLANLDRPMLERNLGTLARLLSVP